LLVGHEEEDEMVKEFLVLDSQGIDHLQGIPYPLFHTLCLLLLWFMVVVGQDVDGYYLANKEHHQGIIITVWSLLLQAFTD